jgi:hypothetical protein
MICNKLKEDSEDTSYDETLLNISCLFNKKNYDCIICRKDLVDDINETIIFVNPINVSDKYTLYIDNKNSITITIPIKKSNYIYRTSFTELNSMYNYLKIHV